MSPRRTEQPWWVGAFERLRPRLLSFVQRRSRVAEFDGPEFVADILADLTEQLEKRRRNYPQRWFAIAGKPGGTDSVEDEKYFDALVWTICRRRLYDRIRRVHLERLHRLQTVGPHLQVSPERRVMLRDLLSDLAVLIDALPDDERDLLASTFERDGRSAPLTGGERIALMRIRRRLAKVLSDQLGEKGAGS